MKAQTMIGAAASLMATTTRHSGPPLVASGFVHLPTKLFAGRQTHFRHFMTSKISRAAQIYVGNISYDTDEQGIRNHFEQYGKLAKIDLPMDRDNKTKHRGFAFLTFEDMEAAEAIINDASSSHLIDGRTLLLSRNHPRGQRNPNRFENDGAEPEGERKNRTLYTIDDSICPPTDEEVLQKIATKHCRSLDKYLDNSPIAAHTKAAFVEVQKYADEFFPGGIPKKSFSNRSDEPGLILDSGVGTGRSSKMLGKRYPNDLIIGVDRSYVRLAKNDDAAATSEDNDNSFVQVVEGQPNVLLVRAELGSFWRLLIKEDWAVKSQYLLYPNPYPKPRRLKSRFYAHPIFPVLLSIGGHIIVRSNWEGYLKEFAASANIVSDYSKTKTINCAGMPILSNRLIIDGPHSVVVENEESALTLFEKKYYECGESIYELRLKRAYTNSN